MAKQINRIGSSIVDELEEKGVYSENPNELTDRINNMIENDLSIEQIFTMIYVNTKCFTTDQISHDRIISNVLDDYKNHFAKKGIKIV